MKVAVMKRCQKRARASSHPAVLVGTARRGFTLVELIMVMAIIGIILAFILTAGMEAARRADERATQTLITKLETALSDRLEALQQSRPEPNFTHGYLAAIYNGTTILPPFQQIKQTERAQVIAWYDYIKSEMPDVFFVQSTAPAGTGYPLNFAAVAITGTDNSGVLGTSANFVLPLGNTLSFGLPGSGLYGDGNQSSPSLGIV